MAIQNLIHGDCMDLMRSKPDMFYDLAIVDPPYGINITKQGLGKGGGLYRQKEKQYKVGAWDDKAPDSNYFDELFRISKNQIIWGGNYFDLPPTPCFIFWDKNNGGSDFADGELAWTSFLSPVRKFRFTWSGFIQGNMGSKKETRIHPTQKPIALYKWLLTNYAKHGDKIFDSHGGSFSHAIAAYDLGFDLDIIELDEDYFKAGKERFDNHVLKCEEIKQFGYAKTAIKDIYPILF